MANRATKLIVNTDAGTLLPTFETVSGVTSPKFVLGDTVPVEIYLAKPNIGSSTSLYQVPFPPGSTTKLAVGVINQTPTAGDWFLSYDGDETTALAAEATAAQVQTALNALASITAAGGVTVTKLGAQFNISFNNPGDRLAFVPRNESLYPASDIALQTLQEGSGTAAEVVLVNLAVRPIAVADSFTDLDPPSGSFTANTFTLGGHFRPGNYRLQLTFGDTYTHTVWTEAINTADSAQTISEKIFRALVADGWGRDYTQPFKIGYPNTYGKSTNTWGLSVSNTDINEWAIDFTDPEYKSTAGRKYNPAAGNFTISFNGNTTTNISVIPSSWSTIFNQTAITDTAWESWRALIETRLNALASITTAGGVTVSVVKGLRDGTNYYNTKVVITWNTVGARPAITVSQNNIWPPSVADITVDQVGDATNPQIVSFAFNIDVPDLVITTPQIVGIDVTELPLRLGKQGKLSFATAEAIAYLGSATRKDAILEVQIETAGESQTLCQSSCMLQGQVIADGAFVPLTGDIPLGEAIANNRFVRRDVAQSPSVSELDIIWPNLGITAGTSVVAAINSANSPDASNPFATMADIGTTSFDQALNTTDSVEFADITVNSGGGSIATLTGDTLTFTASGSNFSQTGGLLLTDVGQAVTYPDATVQTSAPQVSSGTVVSGGTGSNITSADYPDEITITIAGVTYAMPARIV